MKSYTKGPSVIPASTESSTEIQGFIDSNLKLPSTSLIEDTVMKSIHLSYISSESSLHIEEVITELHLMNESE